MPGASTFFVIGIILFASGIGYLASHIDDKTTLRDEIRTYQDPARGTAITGQTLTKPEEDGWSLWDIPLLGPALSIVIGLLSLAWTLLITFFTGLNALLILPTYLPAFAQTILNWIEISVVSVLLLTWLHGRSD